LKVKDIRVYPTRCVGCRICQMICSLTYQKEFRPSQARIMVDHMDIGSVIGFTEDCTKCGFCADYCMYDVLEKVEEGGE